MQTAEALVLASYLGTTPQAPSIAISITTLELYHRLRLRKPSLSVEAFSKVICDLYEWPYRRCYRTALADAFDVYLIIRRNVDEQVREALGCNLPNWRVTNGCPPCGYELDGEPELLYQRMLVFDGNNSLSRMATLGSHQVANQQIFTSNYFLNMKYVDNFAEEVASHQPHTAPMSSNPDASSDPPRELNHDPVVTVCTDSWKAAAADTKKKSWGIFEETCIFASACRHGMILWIADMVRSGELFKYPLSIVNQALEVLGPRLLIAYDIGCKLSTTIATSSLSSKFAVSNSRMCVDAFHRYTHNYACQDQNHPNGVEGAGLEDFGTMERIFSSSNQLASNRYLNLKQMLYKNYVQALKITTNETLALDHAKQSLGINDNDVRNWRAEQTQYLEMCGQESAWDVHTVAYVELLQKLQAAKTTSENTNTTFLNATPTDYQFLPPSTSTTDKSYSITLSCTRQFETSRRHAAERHDMILQDIIIMEVQMGIVRWWEPINDQYTVTVKYINQHKYHLALSNLQCLVILRLLELHKLNLSQTDSRCKAIQHGVKVYNEAAVEIGQPTLDWTKVSHYAFLEEFALLGATSEDIRSKRWAEPAVCELMKQALRVERAHKEIKCCNIEICRLHTAIADEENTFSHKFCTRRRRINAHILACLQDIYMLKGFTGDTNVGVRKGSIPADHSSSSTIEDLLVDERWQLDSDNRDDRDDIDANDAVAEEIGGLVNYIADLPMHE
ncbi:hypothetical protein EV702DRAFT_1177559 [Suillus placidus]|uniref:CxC1-like cysteine cluster associated with KDZ transposases domain-containing protein n=1 Tax=Suillus placidus TaxID=48579 RepID=A0A9P7D6Y8_9AGAM|nr:hypothetical protein EV702DRAFT_1177559 [Suillus placidus]